MNSNTKQINILNIDNNTNCLGDKITSSINYFSLKFFEYLFVYCCFQLLNQLFFFNSIDKGRNVWYSNIGFKIFYRRFVSIYILNKNFQHIKV